MITPVKVEIKPCRCARDCFICTCIRLYVFELTVTGWCIIVPYMAQYFYMVKLHGQLLVSLLFTVIPTYLSNSKFLFISCLFTFIE